MYCCTCKAMAVSGHSEAGARDVCGKRSWGYLCSRRGDNGVYGGFAAGLAPVNGRNATLLCKHAAINSYNAINRISHRVVSDSSGQNAVGAAGRAETGFTVVFTVVFGLFGAGGPREDSLCGTVGLSVCWRQMNAHAPGKINCRRPGSSQAERFCGRHIAAGTLA